LVLAGVISACGGSSGSSGSSDNGVASKSPDAILSDAKAAINGVKSVHVSGSVVSAGSPITLDLDLLSGQGGKGQMSESGLSFQLIEVGKSVYINASPAFWQHFAGSAAAQLFQGKWLKAPSSTPGFASLASLTNVSVLLNTLLSGKHGTLARGQSTVVDGQKVVAVNDTTQGGTLYVATTGKPYPVEILKTGAQGGHVTFDRYNESVSLTPPAKSIDISQLSK
jgi:hypothetical protein